MLELLRQRFRDPARAHGRGGLRRKRPADTTSTEEGRAHNRRVDMVLLSAEALKVEPQAAPAPTPAAPGAPPLPMQRDAAKLGR